MPITQRNQAAGVPDMTSNQLWNYRNQQAQQAVPGQGVGGPHVGADRWAQTHPGQPYPWAPKPPQPAQPPAPGQVGSGPGAPPPNLPGGHSGPFIPGQVPPGTVVGRPVFGLPGGPVRPPTGPTGPYTPAPGQEDQLLPNGPGQMPVDQIRARRKALQGVGGIETPQPVAPPMQAL